MLEMYTLLQIQTSLLKMYFFYKVLFEKYLQLQKTLFLFILVLLINNTLTFEFNSFKMLNVKHFLGGI
jgi:hypothetical protein